MIEHPKTVARHYNIRSRHTVAFKPNHTDGVQSLHMYRHVVTYHLDLGQLWRCPVSWCTVWKGTPQDCMDDVRGVHDVRCDIKSASLEKNSRRGLSSARFGRMPSNPAIRGCPPTSYCSATLTSHWRIILQGLQAWAATSCVSEGLFRMSAGVCVTGNGLGTV